MFIIKQYFLTLVQNFPADCAFRDLSESVTLRSPFLRASLYWEMCSNEDEPGYGTEF